MAAVFWINAAVTVSFSATRRAACSSLFACLSARSFSKSRQFFRITKQRANTIASKTKDTSDHVAALSNSSSRTGSTERAPSGVMSDNLALSLGRILAAIGDWLKGEARHVSASGSGRFLARRHHQKPAQQQRGRASLLRHRLDPFASLWRPPRRHRPAIACWCGANRLPRQPVIARPLGTLANSCAAARHWGAAHRTRAWRTST